VERKLLQLAADETLDVVLAGRVKIIQRREGYRLTEDALHLCKFITRMPEARGIDLGTGCGIIAIVLVKEKKVVQIVGLEVQESLAELARRNVVLNDLGERVEVRTGDIRRVAEVFPPGSFDLVVSNPPYRELGRGRLSPSPERRVAKQEWACSLEDLVKAAVYLMAPKGVFSFCHLEERWVEIRRLLDHVHLRVSRKESILGQLRKPTGLMLVEAERVKGKG
jgi:tRNA1Val (adenine37-N6)-methyltransferase